MPLLHRLPPADVHPGPSSEHSNLYPEKQYDTKYCGTHFSSGTTLYLLPKRPTPTEKARTKEHEVANRAYND